jgi:hypothetical protein
MKAALKELFAEIPLNKPDRFTKAVMTDLVYIKIDGKNRKVSYESGKAASGWTPLIQKLMKEDPSWLQGDIELLWAREYYDILLLKTNVRKSAHFKKDTKAEDIPAYQDKIIKLFEKVPIFMSSQVTDSNKDYPLYHQKRL